METKYFCLGSQSEVEGMTAMSMVVDDEGNPLVFVGNPDKWYKKQEITKEEYDAISSSERNGAFGIVNDQGREARREVAGKRKAKVQLLINNKIDEARDSLPPEAKRNVVSKLAGIPQRYMREDTGNPNG